MIPHFIFRKFEDLIFLILKINFFDLYYAIFFAYFALFKIHIFFLENTLNKLLVKQNRIKTE